MKVFFLDRTRLREKIEETVLQMAEARPEIQQVVLFGSVADGRALPSSDIDLLLIVDDCADRFIDRPAQYRRHLESLPMDVDCFVYSNVEISSSSHPLAKTAIDHGEVIFSRNPS